MKMLFTLLIGVLYAFLMIGFGIWWSRNFDNYTEWKGDEYFVELGVLLGITLLALLAFKLLNPATEWWFVIVSPFVVAFCSIFVMIFLGGVTIEDLLKYPIVFFLVQIFSCLLYHPRLGRPRTSRK